MCSLLFVNQCDWPSHMYMSPLCAPFCVFGCVRCVCGCLYSTVLALSLSLCMFYVYLCVIWVCACLGFKCRYARSNDSTKFHDRASFFLSGRVCLCVVVCRVWVCCRHANHKNNSTQNTHGQKKSHPPPFLRVPTAFVCEVNRHQLECLNRTPPPRVRVAFGCS